MGPRFALSTFVACQGAVGFIMSGCYGYLREPANIGGFVVIYGIFLMLGEMGPGGKNDDESVLSRQVLTPRRQHRPDRIEDMRHRDSWKILRYCSGHG